MPKAKSKVKKEVNTKEGTKPVEKHQQIFKGRVVSVKTKQTATVLLESRKTHLLYKKSYARSKKYLVHDELEVKIGDLVEIVKCRPMSKNKHFKIIKVVGRDIEAIVAEKIKEDVKAAIEEVMPAEKEEVLIEEPKVIEEVKPEKIKKTKGSK